jgi:putative FmdB family regulatory protein
MIGEQMPIYDYHCDQCGHTFSAVQSYTDATLEVCPSCGKKPRKLMATPAIVFKGGGWYKTDSRVTPKEGAADGAKAGGDDPAKTDKKDTRAAPAPATDAAKADGPKADGAKTDGPKREAPKAPRTDKAAPTAPKGESASS